MDYEDKAEEKKTKKEPKLVKLTKKGVTIFRKESLLDEYLNAGWQVVE